MVARLWTALPVVARVAGFAALAPRIASTGSAIQYRIGLALITGLLLMPCAVAVEPHGAPGSPEVVGWLLPHLAVGLSLGFALRMVFLAAEWAAVLVEAQLGLPPSIQIEEETASDGLSKLYQLMALAMFLSLGSHRLLVSSLLDDTLIARGTGTVDLVFAVAAQLMRACWIALCIAAPVVMVLLGTRVAAGMVARVLPQFSAPSLLTPLQIALGFVLLLLSLVMLAPSIETCFSYPM